MLRCFRLSISRRIVYGIAVAAIVPLLAVAHDVGYVNFEYWGDPNRDYGKIFTVRFPEEGMPIADKAVWDQTKSYHVRSEWYKEWTKSHDNETPPDAIQEAEVGRILADKKLPSDYAVGGLVIKAHPRAKLKSIQWFTSPLNDFQHLELWTRFGIYGVPAPAYGSRRLTPAPGKNQHVSLTVRQRENAWIVIRGEPDPGRSEPIVVQSAQLDVCVTTILEELKGKNGFRNLYFMLSAEAEWQVAERIIHAILSKLDTLRGIWIGPMDEGVCIHFHDVVVRESPK